MNRIAFKLMLLGILALTIGCKKPVDTVTFSGTWNVLDENGLAGETLQSRVNVLADGRRFRVTTLERETETIHLYDGKVLSKRITRFQFGDPSKTSIQNEAGRKSENMVEPIRFWKHRYSGDGVAGGKLLGRDTLLFQLRGNTPNGEMTAQAWVDAETKVVLKRIFMVYSPQMEQLITKKTEECTEINYGPVDGAMLKKL